MPIPARKRAIILHLRPQIIDMGQLHQMQIVFVPEQDRLLFRLNTTGRQQQEFRFWLTRRYVRILWKALLNMLKAQDPNEPEQQQFTQEPTKSAVLHL